MTSHLILIYSLIFVSWFKWAVYYNYGDFVIDWTTLSAFHLINVCVWNGLKEVNVKKRLAFKFYRLKFFYVARFQVRVVCRRSYVKYKISVILIYF